MMIDLTEQHRQILNSLITVRKYNRDKSAFPVKFQANRYSPTDLKALEDEKLIRKTMLGEYTITSLGEQELSAIKK
jgi:repressor of nif and glnA expression